MKFPKELRFGIANFKVNSSLSVRNFQKILGKIVMKSLQQGLACSKHALLIIVTWRLAFHLDTSLQPITVLIKNSLWEYKGYTFFAPLLDYIFTYFFLLISYCKIFQDKVVEVSNVPSHSQFHSVTLHSTSLWSPLYKWFLLKNKPKIWLRNGDSFCSSPSRLKVVISVGQRQMSLSGTGSMVIGDKHIAAGKNMSLGFK